MCTVKSGFQSKVLDDLLLLSDGEETIQHAKTDPKDYEARRVISSTYEGTTVCTQPLSPVGPARCASIFMKKPDDMKLQGAQAFLDDMLLSEQDEAEVQASKVNNKVEQPAATGTDLADCRALFSKIFHI